MLAVIYQLTIIQGKEEGFKASWHRLAKYLIENKGALGSCLHLAENGQWVAYSRWPNREVKENGWPQEGSLIGFPKEIQDLVLRMQACIEKKQDPLYLEIVDDLL